MDLKWIKKFDSLYHSAKYLGSDLILKNYLNLPADFPVPLSLAHGVDFGNSHLPGDIYRIEPIHWSTDLEMHEKALKIKQSILMPHPWMMLYQEKTVRAPYKDILVVGAAPSKFNDENLYHALQDTGIKSFDILVKLRGDVSDSLSYLNSVGAGVVSAGVLDHNFYHRLYEIISQYKYVVGCTLSSAIFFASALEKKIILLRNYKYRSIDMPGYLDLVTFDVPLA